MDFDMRKQRNPYKTTLRIVSFITLFISMIGAMTIFYFRPSLGDDVLGQFMYSVTYYLDSPELAQNEGWVQILTLIQSIHNTQFYYMVWNGRILGFFLLPLLSICGKEVVSVFAGIIFSGYIMATLALAFSGWKKAFQHPLCILGLFFFLIFCHIAAPFYFMWTFISMYILTSLLYLLYLIVFDKLTGKKDGIKLRHMIALNSIGLLCGITHELVGAIFALMLIAKGISVIFLQKKMPLSLYIKSSIGFFVGYCICFFAPGNFNRVVQSHSTRHTASFFERMKNAISIHIKAILPGSMFPKYVCACILICACICIIGLIRNKQVKRFVTDNLYLIVGLISPLFLWALVPYTPGYGTVLFCALFWVFVIKMAVEAGHFVQELLHKFRLRWFHKKYEGIQSKDFFALLSAFACSVLIVLIIADNFSWMSSFVKTSLKSMALISESKKNGEEAVYVPLFENEENTILFCSYTNDPNQYSQDYYRQYYGVMAIPTSDIDSREN